MDFTQFTLNVYRERLNVLEQMELHSLSYEETYQLTSEASSMKKFLFDNLEEGYKDTFDTFERELNAVSRLDKIIGRGLDILKLADGENGFFLYPQKVPPAFFPDGNHEIVELHEYLSHLGAVDASSSDIPMLSSFPGWLEKTELILGEMKSYLNWVISSSPDPKFIFLLRDALLPYLALRDSPEYETVPLMIGRSWFGQHDHIFYYDTMIDLLYDAVQRAGISGDGFDDYYAACFSSRRKDLRFDMMIQRLKRVLDSSLKGDGYTIIESGIQGTIPLFLRAMDSRVSEFFMYAALPWLNPYHKGRIFQQNYNYLREMETLVCQDRLFRFSHENDGKIYISVSCDETVRAMAHYEISRFKEIFLNADAAPSKRSFTI